MRRPLLRLLTPLLGAGLFLVALAAAGKATREWLQKQGHVSLAFTAIDCLPPPGEERERFLLEVQSLNGLPDRVSLLEDDLATRLALAFAAHPWVDKVERVAVLPDRRVEVRLVYRTPVLVVTTGEQKRVVDAYGVLLPPGTSTEGLPQFVGSAPPPAGLSGARWGDPRIEAAARTSAYLREHLKERRLIQVDAGSTEVLLLRFEDLPRVAWGHAPGAESGDELAAGEKTQRLRQLRQGNENVDIRKRE
jgi:hypothetical protein